MTQGFFSPEELEEITKVDFEFDDGPNCSKCGLYANCNSPKMKYTGQGEKNVLIIAEASGAEEDRLNTQLIGQAGQLLRKELAELGLDLDRDFWKTNSLSCFISNSIGIYTSRGYKKIKDVEVGDLVLTHKGRFRKVLSRIHDLPKEERRNTERIIEIQVGSKAKFSVTENHKFMVNGQWKKAIELIKEDAILCLGEVCKECGKVFFKSPKVFDAPSNLCSRLCANRYIARTSKDKISASMKNQYKNGTRDRFKITKKANETVRKRIKDGSWYLESWHSEDVISKACATRASVIQRKNKLYEGIIVGFGERELGNYFKKNNIVFYHQYAIEGKNYDFYLPIHNLLIEIENPTTYICNRKIKDVRYSERINLAKKYKHKLHFINSNDPIAEYKRLIKNDTHSYQYTYQKITGLKIKPPTNQLLYCIEVEEDSSFIATGVVHHNCRPQTPEGKNRKPTRSEIKYCKPLVDKTIEELNPSMIWLMGGTAVESMYLNRFKTLAINRWRKLCIPDRKLNKWIIPLFHPSFILRNDYDENLKAVFKRDLKWAVSCINKKPFRYQDETEQVKCLYNFDEIIANLQGILDAAIIKQIFFYIDYETNALKPQWPGAKIASVAYCSNLSQTAIAFPYEYSDFFSKKQRIAIKALWRKIMQHENIYVIAHNIKFENSWTELNFGVKVRNWLFDTMLASHIEDNRSSYTRLKFQAYIKFGVEPYDKEIDPYLKAKSGHFNTIDKAPLDKLLLYNGMDVKVGMNLYHEQQKMFTLTPKLNPKNRFPEAYQLFHEGTLALSDVQNNGVCVDEDYYREKDLELKERIKNLREVKLGQSEEAKLFKKHTGKELDVGSPKDLGVLLYDVLGKEKKLTKNNNYRVDIDALEDIDIPFVHNLRELRKIEKANNTYISQFIRECCNGRIYPFYSLNTVASYRSSSQMPNFQNISSHDPEVGKLIRSGIFPEKGHKILEADYSSIEVKCASIITGDPNLRKYVLDPKTDMHRDVSMDIWMLPKEEITKEIRFNSKGGWTFSQFYGSYYKNCAIDLWKNINCKITSDITLKQHLIDKGIKRFEEFVEHCKDVEGIFWGVRFKKYAQWKKDICDEFRRTGFIENPFGFRFIGNLSEKQLGNYPIQSTAFLILLKSLILISNVAKEEKWLSKLIGQVHDSILASTHPKEEAHVIKTCNYIMSEKVRKLYPWISVPIDIEIEMSGVDQPWWSKKEINLQKYL